MYRTQWCRHAERISKRLLLICFDRDGGLILCESTPLFLFIFFTINYDGLKGRYEKWIRNGKRGERNGRDETDLGNTFCDIFAFSNFPVFLMSRKYGIIDMRNFIVYSKSKNLQCEELSACFYDPIFFCKKKTIMEFMIFSYKKISPSIHSSLESLCMILSWPIC